MAYLGSRPARTAVTSDQITDGVVTAAKLATDSVTTVKIAAANVTTAKITDANVTAAKLAASSALVGRNLIQNGEVAVSQRGTVTGFGAVSGYGPDRWKFESSGAPSGRCTLSQGTGIVNAASSLRVDVTTADSALAAPALYQVTQKIEAQNLHFLEYGAATAKTMTYSFTAKTNFSGAMTLYIIAPDGPRSYATEIDLVGDESQETFAFVIPGDASGAFNFDTGVGLDVMFTLSAGSGFTGGTEDAWAASANNMYGASNSGNFFASTSTYIEFSLMQLEVGSVATDFEHEPFSVTLAKCQRYLLRLSTHAANTFIANGSCNSTTVLRCSVPFPVEMRIGATTGTVSAADGFSVNIPSSRIASTAATAGAGRKTNGTLFITVGSGLTSGQAGNAETATTDDYAQWSAEL